MTIAETSVTPRDSAALAGALGVFGRTALGAGVAGLGALSLIYGDFAMTWQPVPDWLPARTLIAYASGALLALIGAALLLDRAARIAAAVLAGYLASWIVLLHAPRIISGAEAAWLAPAELLTVAAGALTLVGLRAASPGDRFGAAAIQAGRGCFAVTLPVFGVAHFIYIDITAGMLPPWMPASVFWAYLTGFGHVSAGVSIASGVLARIGATLLAIMFTGFVLLVHVPRVVTHLGVRAEWHMLATATALSGAAWLVASALHAARGNIAQD